MQTVMWPVKTNSKEVMEFEDVRNSRALTETHTG